MPRRGTVCEFEQSAPSGRPLRSDAARAKGKCGGEGYFRNFESILEHGLPGGQVLSINIPALSAGQQPAGVKVVRQCTRPWIDTYERRQDPRGRDYFWNSSVFELGETDDDTDVAGLRDNYVTITPLQFDLTDHDLLGKWKERKLSLGIKKPTG